MAEQLFILIIWAVLVVGIGLLARLISTAMLGKTFRLALRDHPASAAPILEKIEERQSWPDNLLGIGMIAAATGLTALALLGAGSERQDKIEAAFLLAMIGAGLLYFAELQRDALRALAARQASEAPGLASSAPASLNFETHWADALMMVIGTAIVLIFAVMTLVTYWQDYPAIVVGGILASLAIVTVVLYRRRLRTSQPS